MAETKCENDTLPDTSLLDIPKNITYFVLAGQNATEELAECCDPNPVQLANGCYNWCEVPAHYLAKNTVTRESLNADLGGCLVRNGGERFLAGAVLASAAGEIGAPCLRVATWAAAAVVLLQLA